MSEYTDLTTKRDELLAKLREIEENCEGIKNKHNAQKVQELNIEQAQLKSQKQALTAKLSVIDGKLSGINSEINKLSATGIDRILEAIKNQRWYFFKNKPKVLMDKLTGILWANLDYFPYGKNNNNDYYNMDETWNVLNSYEFDDIRNWTIPNKEELYYLIENNFPFKNKLINIQYWRFTKDGCYYWLDYKKSESNADGVAMIIPRSKFLIENTDYAKNISENNPVYTEKERLQFTLDLFIQNDLWPIFDDKEVTDLFQKIYFEKPKLIEQLQEVQAQLDKLQTVVLLSSEFDYTQLLVKYNLVEIDKSVIKYYQAVQQWIDELMDKINYFEQQKKNVIIEANKVSLDLSKIYKDSSKLSDAENLLLKNRQKFLYDKLSLGLDRVKRQLLLIKKQADNLEEQIAIINNSENSLTEMAILEKKERASFSIIAENTANIIKFALCKIEYFENNCCFIKVIIKIWKQWTDDYKSFKTRDKEELKNSAEQDGIDENIWQNWYNDWQKLRFTIEEKIQPIFARGLKGNMQSEPKNEITIEEQIIHCLEMYKESVDKFYLEERKNIYQKAIMEKGGELQDKFETEYELYKRTAKFQSDLQEIIFSCTKTADRMFILKWAENLLDIQIDEIISFVADKDLQQISREVLQSFIALKQKNYDAYLNDAKAYSQEKANREKQYNSLMFKMRSELNKQK